MALVPDAISPGGRHWKKSRAGLGLCFAPDLGLPDTVSSQPNNSRSPTSMMPAHRQRSADGMTVAERMAAYALSLSTPTSLTNLTASSGNTASILSSCFSSCSTGPPSSSSSTSSSSPSEDMGIPGVNNEDIASRPDEMPTARLEEGADVEVGPETYHNSRPPNGRSTSTRFVNASTAYSSSRLLHNSLAYTDKEGLQSQVELAEWPATTVSRAFTSGRTDLSQSSLANMPIPLPLPLSLSLPLPASMANPLVPSPLAERTALRQPGIGSPNLLASSDTTATCPPSLKSFLGIAKQKSPPSLAPPSRGLTLPQSSPPREPASSAHADHDFTNSPSLSCNKCPQANPSSSIANVITNTSTNANCTNTTNASMAGFLSGHCSLFTNAAHWSSCFTSGLSSFLAGMSRERTSLSFPPTKPNVHDPAASGSETTSSSSSYLAASPSLAMAAAAAFASYHHHNQQQQHQQQQQQQYHDQKHKSQPENCANLPQSKVPSLRATDVVSQKSPTSPPNAGSCKQAPPASPTLNGHSSPRRQHSASSGSNTFPSSLQDAGLPLHYALPPASLRGVFPTSSTLAHLTTPPSCISSSSSSSSSSSCSSSSSSSSTPSLFPSLSGSAGTATSISNPLEKFPTSAGLSVPSFSSLPAPPGLPPRGPSARPTGHHIARRPRLSGASLALGTGMSPYTKTNLAYAARQLHYPYPHPAAYTTPTGAYLMSTYPPSHTVSPYAGNPITRSEGQSDETGILALTTHRPMPAHRTGSASSGGGQLGPGFGPGGRGGRANPASGSGLNGQTTGSGPTNGAYKYLTWREKDRRRRFREEWKHLWLVIPHGRYECSPASLFKAPMG
ncbi:unnamed protein product [Protopolystoma xenopodis]|uniref:Uncharacterized protein n=1 Tax=Protopolystoma xenopodis TaxID=117903 RepID=A0A3S5BCW6_9PLAT|nr:unnamed protein product [Protopolystoma xenopodis]